MRIWTFWAPVMNSGRWTVIFLQYSHKFIKTHLMYTQSLCHFLIKNYKYSYLKNGNLLHFRNLWDAHEHSSSPPFNSEYMPNILIKKLGQYYYSFSTQMDGRTVGQSLDKSHYPHSMRNSLKTTVTNSLNESKSVELKKNYYFYFISTKIHHSTNHSLT